MPAVKSQLRAKFFFISEEIKTVNSVNFFGYSISKKETTSDPKQAERNSKAPINNKQLESSVGLASLYGKMVTNFALKLLPLNDMRNCLFSRGTLPQNEFERMKTESRANP